MNEQSHARLGAFLLLGCALLLATAVFYASRLQERETLDFVTYFDQPINGLDKGAVVRFRGVDVGKVDGIGFAGSQGWIEVGFGIDVEVVRLLGADVDSLRERYDEDETDDGTFRVKLESNLVTGLSYLQIDRPENDVEILRPDFAIPRRYIPSMPTTTVSMVQSLNESLAKLPLLLDSLDATSRKVEAVAEQARRAQTPAAVTALVVTMREQLQESRLPQTAAELRQLLPRLGALLADLRALSEQLKEQPESLIFGPRPTEELSP